jgi:hypothetical protein
MTVYMRGVKLLFEEDDETQIQIGRHVWTLVEEDGTLAVYLRPEGRDGMAPRPRVNIGSRRSYTGRRIRNQYRAAEAGK